MRQLWISTAILLGMLLLLAWNAWYFTGFTETLTENITQATAAAKGEDWTRAEDLSAQARQTWQDHKGYLQLVQCHGDIIEIAVLLEESSEYLACRDLGEYAAENARILGAVERLQGLERLSAGTLF